MKNTKHNRVTILDKAILYGIATSCYRKPGQVIMAMSKEDRELLRRLKSDDIKDTRW